MKKRVYAYLHTHWDREWYREFEAFRLRLVQVVDDIISKLQNNEIESFYFDGQTCAIEDYLEIKPFQEYMLKKLVKEQRLFIGPYYCSTDSFLVDSESLIKNLQIGLKYSKTFGNRKYIAYHADTFGHSKYIPDIIKYFGLNNAIFWRGLGEINADFDFNGLTSTYLIEGYFHDYLSADVSYEKKAEMIKKTLDRIAQYSSDNLLLPLGADHLACANNVKEQIAEINRRLDDYEIILTDPFEYFDKTKDTKRETYNQEFRSTKRNFILPGVLSSRIDLKQANAKLQWQIARLTQPFNAISYFLYKTENFQGEIDYAHKELIKNQPHDSIYGCSIDSVHQDNTGRYKNVSEVLKAITGTLKCELLNNEELSVFNFSNFELNGCVKTISDQKPDEKYNAQIISVQKGFPLQKVYDDTQIPITEDYTNIYEYIVDLKNIKPFSTKEIDVSDINQKSSLKIKEDTLENENIKLEINKDIINIRDKKSKKTYKNILKIKDVADIGDSYNFGALKNDKPIYAKIAKTRIKEKGHLRSTLEIKFEINIPTSSTQKGRTSTTKKQDIYVDAILENQNDFIEFKIDWENKSKNHLLQTEFNLPQKITQVISDDLAGYTARNFDPKYSIYNEIPAKKGIELETNTAPLQKAAFCQNLGLITKGLHEYEVESNKLSLTILRATGTISNPHNPTRGTPAGPPLPTPDLQRLCKNTANFAITFKNSISELEPNIEKFYNTNLLIEAKLNNQIIFENKNQNILVNTVKTDCKNNMLIRYINKSDEPQKFDFNANTEIKTVFIADAMEYPIRKYEPFELAPHSFVTLLLTK